MLTKEGCEGRQGRLRAMLGQVGLEGLLVSDPLDIYWATGLLLERYPALLYVEREGGVWLACHTEDGEALVDGRATYPPHLLFTSNPDPRRLLTTAVGDLLDGKRRGGAIGWQSESLPRLIGEVVQDRLGPASWVGIDDELARLQKRKAADEVALMRRAAECSVAAYAAVREEIRAGVTELEVLEAGHRAATLAAGEIVFHNGDYQAGEFGGFARNRAVEDGELYVIDAWTTYRGYWSDLCRTLAVGAVTALQRDVHDHVRGILEEVPGRLEPGMRGTELWRWIDARLREHPHLGETGLVHHAGHGVGLRAHEAPDLNRDREGIIEVGDVVSVEPGAYSAELRAGVRLENTFWVGESGVELLSGYPLTL